MGTDADNVQRAKMLAAEVVTALLDGTADVRVLRVVHGSITFPEKYHTCAAERQAASVYSHYMTELRDYTSACLIYEK